MLLLVLLLWVAASLAVGAAWGWAKWAERGSRRQAPTGHVWSSMSVPAPRATTDRPSQRV